MVKTFRGLFDIEDIEWFKSDMSERIKSGYVDRPFDPDSAKKIFGVECGIHDRRYILSAEDESYQRLVSKISNIIPNDLSIYMAYQRQYLPHLLHVDEVCDDTRMDWAYSAIIPLDPNISNIFKTLVWKKICPRFQDLTIFFDEFIKDSSKFEKLSDSSDRYDVDHVWTGIPHICDYMEFDDAYTYELGTMGMFNRTHVHCSSNWKKYNLWEYKDIILLHIG